MLEQFKDINNTKHNNFIVHFGPHGSGKTTYLGTMPKPLGIFSINDDGGLVVLQNKENIKFIDYKDEIINGKQSTNALMQLIKLIDELMLIPTDKQPFKTFAIEMYSEIPTSIVKFYHSYDNKQMHFSEMKKYISDPMLILRDKLINFANTKNVLVVASMHTKTKYINLGLTDEIIEKTIPNLSETNGDRVLEKADKVFYFDKHSYKENNKEEFGFLLFTGIHSKISTKIRLIAKEIPLTILISHPTYDKVNQILKDIEAGKKIIFPELIFPKKDVQN